MHNHDIHLSDIRCVHASAKDVATGLLAYVSFRIGNVLFVDGVTVRRTRDNRIVLSWPCRTDGAGRRHPVLRPVDDASRQRLEKRILKALAENPPEEAP
jgi:DNA-binding cell septation regulator SpoVG